MNLEIRRAVRSALVPGLGPGPSPEEGGPDHADEPEADQGGGRTLETEDAPEVRVRKTPTPETEAGDLEADPEIERKMIQGDEDPKLRQKATAQLEDHAARAGDAEEVEVAAASPSCLLREETPGLHLLEDTRRKRKRIRKGTGTARVIKNVVARNVNAPSARKRKAKTKNESGRGNQMETKEM